MAEKKISELVGLTSVSGGAILPIVAGDTTYSTTVEKIADYVATEESVAKTNATNTFANTQNFNGAVFLNGDVNIVGNLIGEVRNEINSLEAFTASLRTEVNGIEAYTASLKGTTLISGSAQISALGFSAATNGTVSSSAQITELPYIHSTTSSLNTFTGSVQSEVNALKTATSSYVVNSLTSSFVSYTELSQSFANFTSSVVNLHNDVNIISSSIYLNSNEVLYRSSEGGNPYVYLRSYDSDGLSLNVNNKSWKITTDGTITTSDSSDIESSVGVKVFNSLAKIHTYTGSLRSEVNLIEEYTASLKTSFSVTESMVNFTSPITSSLIKINNILKLQPTGSLLDTPLSEAGMVMASASYGFTNLYLFDGSDWKVMLTGSI